MKKVLLVMVAMVAAGLIIRYLAISRAPQRSSNHPPDASSTGGVASIPVPLQPAIPAQRRSILGREEREGQKQVPEELVKMLRSGDYKEWRNGLNWLFQRNDVDRGAVIELLRSELNSPLPEKRIDVAEFLLRLGYTNDIAKVLTGLVKINPSALLDFMGKLSYEQGIPRKGFSLICQYRLSDALADLPDLLAGHPHRFVIYKDLALLGDRSIIAEVIERQRTDGDQIEVLGILKATEALPLVEQAFATARDGTRKKTYAAWALAQLGQMNPALTYLSVQAQQAVSSLPALQNVQIYNEKTEALQYLASIEMPEVKAQLEAALQSKNQTAIEYSLVNLLLRFPDSQKAKDYLAELLTSGGGSTFRYQLAAAVNDRYVNARVPPPTQYNPEQFAWIYRVHQKDWSIYNWVQNYTVNYTHTK